MLICYLLDCAFCFHPPMSLTDTLLCSNLCLSVKWLLEEKNIRNYIYAGVWRKLCTAAEDANFYMLL